MTAESCSEDGKVRNQYLAAIVVNILSFAHGCTTGWVSPYLPLMSSQTDTPLDIPLTTIQGSFVASVVCIGGLVGTPFYGTLADKFGRKISVLVSAIPCALAWILILTWRTSTGIMMARLVAGFGGAGPFLIGPIYCVEIASLSSKGALGSLMVFTINGGIVAMYFMGAHLSYNVSAIAVLLLIAIFFVVMLKMPETPVFLVKQRKEEEAAKAIAWLRSEPLDSHVVRRVLAKLKHESELAGGSINEDTSMSKIPQEENISPWKFFFTSPPTLRAFSVCFILLTIQVCTGMFAIVTFANDIFAQAGSTLPPSTNTIIIGLLQLVGSIIGSFVIEKTGRKVLLISSCAVVSIGNITIGTYFYAINIGFDMSSFGWIPVTALSFVVCTFAMGIGPVPYILPSEIIMVQGRGVASSIILSWVWIASFIIAQTFQQLVEMLGSHVVFWMYGIFASTGILVTMMLLPETKGRSFESILAFYSSKKDKKAFVTGECENGELL